MKRRRYLATLGAGSLGGLAGCVSLGGEPDGSGSEPGGERTSDRATLRALDVGGASGGPIPVLPAEPTLLDFWATWCAPCKPQMAELRAVNESFPGAHILSITNEADTGAVREFWAEYEGTWAVAQDTDLRTNERFGVTRMPTLLVFDADGAEVWRHVGLAAADTIAAKLREAGARGN
jgi:thiol-disulfide isomerase/thioredoxin